MEIIMPSYDYRCNQCGRALTLFYKTYAAYDAAEKTCSNCGSGDLTRVIANVTVQSGEVNYRKMSSGEMLSVLEGGKRGEVETMYRQLGADPDKLANDAKKIKNAKDDE
jgi:putative FmdB family regulatory protein